MLVAKIVKKSTIFGFYTGFTAFCNREGYERAVTKMVSDLYLARFRQATIRPRFT